MLHLHFLHPVYAIAGVFLLSLVAAFFGLVIPFYRRELKIEDATRLTPLDGLRGILAFAVLFHHAAITRIFLNTNQWNVPPSAFYTLLGQTGVALFFCVTGFLFWSKAMAIQGNFDVWPFLRARCFRIIPLYLFSSLFILIFLAGQIHWLSLETLKSLGTMATMGMQLWTNFGTQNPGEINAHVTWSLQYEWAFYFALPALALVIQAGKPWRICLPFLALYIVKDGPHMYFLSGIVAAQIAGNPEAVRILKKTPVTVAILILLILLCRLSSNGYDLTAEILTTLIFIPIACGNSIFGILNWSGLRLMGMVSYSVYLLHGISLYLARPLLAPSVRQGDYSMRYWVYTFSLSCLILILSLLTYRWIELPFIRREKRLRTTRQPAEVSAASPAPAN